MKREILVRYLSADARAVELPRDSTAITPANYRFQYAGTIDAFDSPVYAFRIIPRKKRVGLMNGAVWLDGDTGIAVRLSGYLVRMPSPFVTRVNITRENQLRDSIVETTVTHISVKTRLAGPAQLFIRERPLPTSVNCHGIGR